MKVWEEDGWRGERARREGEEGGGWGTGERWVRALNDGRDVERAAVKGQREGSSQRKGKNELALRQVGWRLTLGSGSSQRAPESRHVRQEHCS